jgi:hypothetical protein
LEEAKGGGRHLDAPRRDIPLATQQSLGQQQQDSTSPKNGNAATTTTSTSLGSFLNNMQQRHRNSAVDDWKLNVKHKLSFCLHLIVIATKTME